MNKKLLCLAVMAVMAALGAHARGTFDHDANFQWELSGDGSSVIVTGYTGDSADVWIPPRIQGLPVTGIGDHAFSDEGMGDGFVQASRQFTSVIIPNTVTHIGEEAFRGSLLSEVTIPESVAHIALGAFCSNRLESVRIANGATHIGDWAFCCNQLTSVNFGDNVVAIGEGAFHDNLLTCVNMPDSVAYIGFMAFADNHLTAVRIPDSVSYIGGAAFLNNYLASVDISDNVAVIGFGAFAVNYLTSVRIPYAVTHIGDAAFAMNPLTSISIGSDVIIGDALPYFPSDIFSTSFAEFYKNMGRMAGTFIFTSGVWSVQFRGQIADNR